MCMTEPEKVASGQIGLKRSEQPPPLVGLVLEKRFFIFHLANMVMRQVGGEGWNRTHRAAPTHRNALAHSFQTPSRFG
jgi:hypothetical protein